MAGLNELDAQAQLRHQRRFIALAPEQRSALVEEVHDAAVTAERALTTPPAQLTRPFILMTKELTLHGFCSTQLSGEIRAGS